MPLWKKTPPSDQHDENRETSALSRAAARVVRADYAYAAFEAPDAASLPTEAPRVGDFLADYSELTPADLAETDLECAELFAYSKPIPSKRETALECAELFENSAEVSEPLELDLDLSELFKHSKSNSR